MDPNRVGFLSLLLAFGFFEFAGGSEAHAEPKPTHFEVVAFNWEHVETPYTIAVWIVLASIAKILFHISKRFADTFPDSSLLIVVGLVLGYGLKQLQVDDRIFSLESTVFFLYLLPPIIFEAGYFMPNRALFENLDSVMLFAVVGTIWNTITISVSLYVLGQFNLFTVQFSAFEILLFASLISAVDPVAVIAVFEEVHVNEFLFVNVFGEALFNDGVTVVLYQMFKKFVLIGEDNLDPVDYAAGGLSFIVIGLGGILIGMAFAFAVSFITKYTDKVKILAPMLIFVFPYLAYLTAELFGLSSILAIVACGICMKQYVKGNISHSTDNSVKYFTKMLAQCTETIIFMFLGLSTISNGHHWDTWFVCLTIGFCLLYRVIGVVVQCAILNRFRKKKFSFVDQFILSYGGLRGAIAFGLVVSLPDEIPRRTCSSRPASRLSTSPSSFSELEPAAIVLRLQHRRRQNLGITIRPVVNFLKVERDDKRQQTMLESVYGRYFDYTMAGVEDIAGQKGRNSVRDTFERFNATILRPLLMKHTKKNRFDASQIIRAYNKITLQEALDMANENKRIVEKRRGSIAPENLRNMVAAYTNKSFKVEESEPSKGDGTDVIDLKNRKDGLKNELERYMAQTENTEALYLMFSQLLDRKLTEMHNSTEAGEDNNSDIEDDYMEAMVRPAGNSVSATNLDQISRHESTSLANGFPGDLERGLPRPQPLTRCRSMGASEKKL
ncbi:hypothetical protein L596_008342 [Steinernema carpocapsae]|uniref:Sodium/hydrogen exchanger n=1 Tax=Steinernema carpocapsae TaxID=34508 RepID=A0A4U5PD94_STECR|nr:hypothetical protein L596_008342 [Steinernema carpocapsae]